uniref:AIG1-type G domain-containing protein n=1 Tax=Amphimedon queenslandica TaxID=400682 RepID=A0A1X7V7I6_AMPQE
MAAPKPEAGSIQGEVFSDIIQSYITPTKGRELKIVVVGEAGQGKSTLINGLLGKEVANEGDQFDAGTAEIKYYNLNQNGISVKIWDTPGFGFGSEEEDQKMVEQLRRSDCFPHDLALFCFRMDGTRFPTRVHTTTVKILTQVFGRKFWEHTVFILTFANALSQLCPKNEELDEFFSNRICMLEEKIHAMLRKTVDGLSDDEVEKIRAIPVGSYKKGGYDPNDPWRLPDREDWFLWFWIECTEHIRQASFRALLQANRHRIKIPVVSEVAPAYGEDPPLHKEAYERSIQAPKGMSLEEIDDGVQDGGSGGGLETCEDNEKSRTASLQSSRDTVIPIENSTGVTTKRLETSLHDRDIPILETLNNQMKNEESSFFQYVKNWIGEKVKAFREWLGKKTTATKQKEE